MPQLQICYALYFVTFDSGQSLEDKCGCSYLLYVLPLTSFLLVRSVTDLSGAIVEAAACAVSLAGPTIVIQLCRFLPLLLCVLHLTCF